MSTRLIHIIPILMTSIFVHMPRVLIWIAYVYGCPLEKDCIDHWFTLLQSWTKHHGERKALENSKLIRNCVTKYIAGDPVTKSRYKLSRRGIPTILGPIARSLIKGENHRMILTLLSITRAVSLPPLENFSSITDPFKGDITAVVSYIPSFWKALDCDLPKDWKSYHINTKSGPNGQTLASCLHDVQLLPEWLVEDIGILGGPKLSANIDKIRKTLASYPQVLNIFSTFKTGRLRKLSCISDKEGKTRVVAIFDYWSQCCLKPLSDWMFILLKGLEQDCTFNQGSFHQKLTSKGPYYSFDLTNATDRFPLSLQVELLSYKIGKVKALAWSRVLTKIPFETKSGLKEYSCGQPMGSMSSWSAFTLCHHYVMFVASKNTAVNLKGMYVMLGDDIVIANELLALEYKRLMGLLDVQISPLKSHVSADTYEFAKRWIHRGVEITPFPVAGLKETGKRYYFLLSFLDSVRNLGWSSPMGLADQVCSYFKIVLMSSRLSTIHRPKINKAILVMKMIKDYISPTEFVITIQRDLGLPCLSCGNKYGGNVILDVMDERVKSLLSKSLVSKIADTLSKTLREIPEIGPYEVRSFASPFPHYSITEDVQLSRMDGGLTVTPERISTIFDEYVKLNIIGDTDALFTIRRKDAQWLSAPSFYRDIARALPDLSQDSLTSRNALDFFYEDGIIMDEAW